jgi:predicted lipoprotein with Yx(FWY)xxD motif
MGMRVRMRRALLPVVLAAVVTMGTVACGSSTTDAGSGGSTGSSPTTSTSASGSTGTSEPTGTTPVGPVDIVVISTPYGDALGTDDGLVLYAWDTEADGTVACVDAECVETWPPVLADEVGDVGDLDPARFTVVQRPDGTTQLALDARPLYHMAADEPGEANCQGTDGWWILNPDGTKNTNETERAASTTTPDLPGY